MSTRFYKLAQDTAVNLNYVMWIRIDPANKTVIEFMLQTGQVMRQEFHRTSDCTMAFVALEQLGH